MSSYPILITEDIVISGMSGRFPESNSTDEFARRMFNKEDLITTDNRRWPIEMFGMNPRMGKVNDVDKFDGHFFGIMVAMGSSIDPQSRMLLETTYECIIDAGINPQSLRGSDTGVYIGFSTFGMPDCMPEDVQPDSSNNLYDTLLWLPGSAKCLYANRLSFVFDFKGPSLVIDTACSSSLVALNTAMNDLRLGKCKQAIVGGTQLCLQPFTNHIFQTTSLNSPEGIPKVWDESADGFVRGETVSCVLLQRKSDSKRIYATVLNSGVNIDGNKRMGMFFPSSESQEELMVQVYKEANVDPLKVNYFEAHSTGTKVGDPMEAKAIYNAFCAKPKRQGVLPVGLIKSNIGHSEGASGMSSLAKVLIAFENECIPANLHLKTIKTSIRDYCPPLQPINDNLRYTPGIAGVNNFGVGGVNANLLLEPNYKLADEDSLKIADTIPRIVNICCRTEEALNQMFAFIQNNPQKITRDFLALLADTMRVQSSFNSSGFPWRGSIFIKQIGDNQYEYKKQSAVFSKNVRPLYFLFPGLGGQWVGMAKALMPIKIFADKINECHDILKPYGIDLRHLLLSDDNNSMFTMTNKFCATTAIEIALCGVIQTLGITPDGIIGHSFGEIAAAYADGCLTTGEALMMSYFRGVVTESDKKIPKGLMAVVGLSWSEAKKLCPKGTSPVCNNGKDTVVVSGLYKETKQMVEDLNKKGVFVRELQSSDIPYHSEYLMTSAKRLTDETKKCVRNPRLRSKKWISTSVVELEPSEELTYASAEYFVHNLISPVYFYDKFKYLPSNAIILEIGPHGLFAKVVKETLESGTYVSLIKKDSNDTNLDMFLHSIAKLYELGLNPLIENLYPKVEWPVARSTQSISSLIKWDHNDNYHVKKYPDYHFRSSAADLNEAIYMSRALKSFLPEHVIDGNMLYPATGYLMLAWRRMAASYGRIWNQIPVIFEDVQFRRAIFFGDSEETRIKVKYLEHSGEFAIYESNHISCVGKIRTTDEYCLSVQHLLDENNGKQCEVELTAKDIYKDLKTLGYDYGPKFRKLQSIRSNDFKTLEGDIEWDGNWITFMDSLLQTMALGQPFKKMMVPVMIKSLRCDPKVLYEGCREHRMADRQDVNIVTEEAYDEFVTQNRRIDDEVVVSSVIETQNIEYIEELFGKEFHNFKAVLPFYVNMNSRMIVTKGIELEDMMALPMPRKTNLQDLKLESYQFVPNEDNAAIDDNHKQYLAEYIKVCETYVNKIKQMIEYKDHKVVDNGLNDDLLDKYLSEQRDDHILLKLLNQLHKDLKDENQNVVDSDKFVTNLLAKPEFDMSLDVINQVSKNEHLIRSLLDIVSENNVPKKEIRVLEINLTNSLMAKEVDNHLASAAIYPIDVNYTIASKSTDVVREDMKNKSFKLITWDPKESSTDFPLDYMTPTDLVILKDSYDMWSLDMDNQLQSIVDIVTNKGFLLSVFRHEFTKPELTLNSMNGKLENLDLQKRIVDFITNANKIGFVLIGKKCDSIGSMSLLFRKVTFESQNPKLDQIISVKSDCNEWFHKLKQKLEDNTVEDTKLENIWLIANDCPNNGIIGLVNCLRLEPGGDHIRCIFDCNGLCDQIDFNAKPFAQILTNDLAINVIQNGQLGSYRHLTLPKNYDKVDSHEYYLNTGQTKDLASLQWFDLKRFSPHKIGYDLDNKQINFVRCNIYSCGINFRDIMVATGRIPSGPLSLFTDCLIGFEFAGRRADTGERICGFDISRCFASNVKAMSDMISVIPDNWTMDDAVTILSTYSTVWYGLIERAQLKPKESILIHSAAGGVGQAALNVCKYYNCDIFVTVGTEDKKKFLMTEYNIPKERIFNSRDIQFKHKIKLLTDGKGVDLVLNSLTGDKLEASYECVADCGRFVEIGKYDLQMNKQLGMFSFLRDISFIAVSVDRKLFLTEGYINKWWQWMYDNCTNGMIKPINRTIFKAEKAETAFRYMTTGKHIGKIVIKIRDEESKKIVVKTPNPSPLLTSTVKTYFDSNKCYIITGGLGGFGIEMAHWMISLGARNLVMTSRYGLKTDYQKFVFKRIESLSERYKFFGTKIMVWTKNTDLIDNSKQLLTAAQSIGPIGGVFHLSVVLNDCLFGKQEIKPFIETIESKTKTFENLDKLSREMDLNLDYFVVFSSVSCGKGNAGQSNYGFANSVCERICELRRRDGLHGLAIQWGPIGDVGVLAESDINTSLAGIVKQRINSCLEIFDKLLQTQHSVVSCVVRAKRQTTSGTREAKIVAQIWQALGIDPKTTPDHLTLGEIGIESMFAVELQQGLERDYDIKVSMTDIKNITIGMMKDFEVGKVQEMKQFSQYLRECRTKLSKIKFIIPTDGYTKLNVGKTGKPVYFLPPLEGIFSSLEPLAAMIERPVIGLNWTKNMENMSIKELSIYYTNMLNSLHPKGDYDIFGHFYGALIAIKMLKIAPIGKAVIIDMLSETKLDAANVMSDDYILELIIAFISKDLPQVVRDKIKRDCSIKPDINSKLIKISDELKEFAGKSLVSRDLEEILLSSHRKVKLFSNYRINLKNKFSKLKVNIGRKYLEMSGKLLIIKPSKLSTNDNLDSDEVEKIKNAYFLPEKGLEGKLNFQTINGSDDQKEVSDAFDKIADSINKYLSK